MTIALQVLLAMGLAVATIHLALQGRRPHPGEFDDIARLDRQLAALARARKDHP